MGRIKPRIELSDNDDQHEESLTNSGFEVFDSVEQYLKHEFATNSEASRCV